MIARSPGALSPSLALLCLALAATACPQRVDPEPTKQASKGVSPDDPRVVHDTDDLYAQRDPPPPGDGPAPGSGVPDETNGVCRLYAPKIPRPECCAIDFGLDVAAVQRACGHSLYLGESIHASCGYHFGDDAQPTAKAKWLRLSFTLQPTTREAAKAHDERIGFRLADDPNFHSTPIPGVKDGLWSRHGDLRWAFLPGWSKPRMLSWNAESCSDEGILEVIQQLVAAPEVKEGTPRRSLIPGGPPTPAPAEAPAVAG